MEEKRKKEKIVEATIIADYKKRDRIFTPKRNSIRFSHIPSSKHDNNLYRKQDIPSSNASYSNAPNSNV